MQFVGLLTYLGTCTLEKGPVITWAREHANQNSKSKKSKALQMQTVSKSKLTTPCWAPWRRHPWWPGCSRDTDPRTAGGSGSRSRPGPCAQSGGCPGRASRTWRTQSAPRTSACLEISICMDEARNSMFHEVRNVPVHACYCSVYYFYCLPGAFSYSKFLF